MTPETQTGVGQTPAQQRREKERAAARETILSAALDVARRDGWDAVTMRRLADEIAYSANFAYRYFAGRDDILRALVRAGFSRLRDAMAAASDHGVAGPSAEAAAAAVRGAAHAYLDFALAEADLYQLMYGLGGVRVPTADTWVDGQAIGDLLTKLLAAGGDAEPQQHILQLWATAHGLIALQVVGRVKVDAAALHALLEDALTDCLSRVLPGPKPSGTTRDLTRAKRRTR